MQDTKLNLNQYVRFKMKPQGVKAAREYWESVYMEFPNAAFPCDKPGVECRAQLHTLFRMFGGECMGFHANGSPIYDLVIEPLQ